MAFYHLPDWVIKSINHIRRE